MSLKKYTLQVVTVLGVILYYSAQCHADSIPALIPTVSEGKDSRSCVFMDSVTHLCKRLFWGNVVRLACRKIKIVPVLSMTEVRS
jgi:hypothetical protein